MNPATRKRSGEPNWSTTSARPTATGSRTTSATTKMMRALMKHPDKTPATPHRETTAVGLVFAEFWYATQARGDHHVVRLVGEVTEPRDGRAGRGG